MEGMGYYANMVGRKESSANQIGLSDSSTDLEKKTTVVTSSKMGVVIGFATYCIVEHYKVEAGKKKLGLKTYQIASVSIGDAG